MPHPIRVALVIPSGAQFGAPRGGGTRTHRGTDYHAPNGTPIYGTGEGGAVTFIGYNGDPNLGFGHYVAIRYADGRTTLDAHMRERSPLRVGALVGPNTVIGYLGKTGNAVNADPQGPWLGNHDHHECRVGGRLVDPFLFYGGTVVAGNDVTPISQEEDEMNDAERELLRQANENAYEARITAEAALVQITAIHAALFIETPTSRGSSGGVLAVLGKIEGPILATRDALFITSPTSFGTPGGVLKTLRTVTDKLGITQP